MFHARARVKQTLNDKTSLSFGHSCLCAREADSSNVNSIDIG